MLRILALVCLFFSISIARATAETTLDTCMAFIKNLEEQANLDECWDVLSARVKDPEIAESDYAIDDVIRDLSARKGIFISDTDLFCQLRGSFSGPVSHSGPCTVKVYRTQDGPSNFGLSFYQKDGPVVPVHSINPNLISAQAWSGKNLQAIDRSELSLGDAHCIKSSDPLHADQVFFCASVTPFTDDLLPVEGNTLAMDTRDWHCGVYYAGTLNADQERCLKTTERKENGQFVLTFEWLSGSKTVVHSPYSKVSGATLINGEAALKAPKAPGSPSPSCIVNSASGNMFCEGALPFTRLDVPTPPTQEEAQEQLARVNSPDPNGSFRDLAFGTFQHSFWFVPEGKTIVEIATDLEAEGWEIRPTFDGVFVNRQLQMARRAGHRITFGENQTPLEKLVSAMESDRYFIGHIELSATRGIEQLKYVVLNHYILIEAEYTERKFYDRGVLSKTLVDAYGQPQSAKIEDKLDMVWQCSTPNPVLSSCPEFNAFAASMVDYGDSYIARYHEPKWGWRDGLAAAFDAAEEFRDSLSQNSAGPKL